MVGFYYRFTRKKSSLFPTVISPAVAYISQKCQKRHPYMLTFNIH